MSNIPKVPKLPKTKSVSSQDHTSPEHEILLNKTWANLDEIIRETYEIGDKKFKLLQEEAIQSYIESYEERIRKLEAQSTENAAQKKLLTESIKKIKDHTDNFTPPLLDVNQCALEITKKKYQKELLNEKDIAVGYVDIYVEFDKISQLTLDGKLDNFYMINFGHEADSRGGYIKKLCQIDFKVPEWSIHKTIRCINIDVRATVPTLAQLTRELQVIKSYMDGPNLAVVFNHIENPLTEEVLAGHSIVSISLSDFDL